MKNMKSVFLLSAGIVFASSFLSAAESLDNLLAGYMRNDLSVQKESGNMQKVLLQSEITDIEQGFSFQIETGTVTVTTGAEGSVKFSPKAEFSIPQAANLGISVSTDIEISWGSEDTDVVSNMSLGVSADIISDTAKKRKLTKIKSERTILEAKRSLQNTFVKAEKEFYTSLKKLYTLVSSVIDAEKDLYDDQLNFEQIKAQGYRTSSTKYRKAQMDVLAANHTVESKKRELMRETRIFAAKCGIMEFNYENAEDFLPTEIPLVEAVKIRSFGKDAYSEIEKAKWIQYINGLERDANGDFNLTASAGYTFKNSKTKSDTIDVGAKFKWLGTGLVASAGTSMPIGKDSFTPVYTFGVSVDPAAFKKASVQDEIEQIEISQEELDISSAEKSFFTAVIAQHSELSNIEWERTTYEESLDMYTGLEADMKKYYSQGIITESEYLSTKVNKENYRIKCITNRIEQIIYNADTKLMFVRDSELEAVGAGKTIDDSAAEKPEEENEE